MTNKPNNAGMIQPEFDITYTDLPDGLYTPYRPALAPAPKPVLLNHDLAHVFGLNADWLASQNALDFFAGHKPADTYAPIAMAYSGHQFGGFSPRLGDGRAALIAEFLDSKGVRHDIHLKGSGRTPYSRGGDGKATLRAVLKEYIFSESLAALGIPTTRSLAALTTGEIVPRRQAHPGAILVRTAKSHIRVGTFQFARMMHKDKALEDKALKDTALKYLADYTIARLYPDIGTQNPYKNLLATVIEKQANLVAKWMSFGFIHGVMNTDNMAISGETIDFGPCAFMEDFHTDKVFSSVDHLGRYAWNKQPEMALWNLTRFAESLLPILHTDEDEAVKIASTALDNFSSVYAKSFNGLMLAKLGLRADTEGARELLGKTVALLSQEHIDFTLFFRRLTDIANAESADGEKVDGESADEFLNLFSHKNTGKTWLTIWHQTIDTAPQAAALMRPLNPVYIPRYTQLETALEAAEQGDMTKFNQLRTAVTTPFDEQKQYTNLATPAPNTNTHVQTFCET